MASLKATGLKSCVLVTGLTLISSFAIAANIKSPALPSTFPAAAEARATQLNAKISSAARAWIQQEAKRESDSNDISEASARKAISGAGSAIDLSKMSVEDAIVMIMMEISNDASNEMRQMLAESKEANANKKALRDKADERKSEVKVAANTNLRIGLTSQPVSSLGANNTIAVNQAALQKQTTDSANDQGEPDQLKLQPLLDRRNKAIEIASNVLKKSADVSSAMTGNIK
jgi:hypothetical protein